ncbi:MAG: InlB B-repeat-containing protein, partial [Eubacteriales bacterium]
MKLGEKFKKAIAVFIAAAAMITLFSGISLAADTTNASRGSDVDAIEPIPLLVIKISFDADGDGKDWYYDDNYMFGAPKDPNSPAYGEQWCYSDDEYWSKELFSDSKWSLKSYYNFISNGSFYFYPAEETYSPDTYKNKPNNGEYDGVNDGIIHVVLSGVKHPDYAGGEGLNCGNERTLALKAADQYVDFSKYDKNHDGFISYKELSIAFVYGGIEVSYGGAAPASLTMRTHAAVTWPNMDVKLDGVRVLNSAYSGSLRVGDCLGTQATHPGYGTFAHELGHVLGAADLYTRNEIWIGSPGALSLMGTGSKGRAEGSGKSGSSPAILDPYYAVAWGFAPETVAENGKNEYTLYSHESGKYNVLRINTSNPDEYYLVENRSHSKESYDYNGLTASDVQGIVIWHVDNHTMCTDLQVNTGGRGHDSGLTVLTPKPEGEETGKTYETGATTGFTKDTAQFDCTEYEFFYSNTWYTVMTADEAATCNIKIEVLDEAGDEMRIVVDSTSVVPVRYTVEGSDRTISSFSLNANITDYGESAIEYCKFAISEKRDMSDPIEKTFEKDNNGVFTASFEGLKEGTTYYYTVEIKTEAKTITKSGIISTASTPVAATSYTLTIYKKLTDNDKGITMKIKFGEKFTYSFPMTKSGYEFGGWYLDEACTEKFDMNFTQDEENDFSIYAKWIPKNDACVLKVNGATYTNKIFAVEAGETFIEPQAAEKEGYEFIGWFADEACTTPFDFSKAVSATGTVNVYAKYKSLSGDDETTTPISTTAAT